MNDKAEKVYGEAFFALCLEEAPDKLADTLAELSALSAVFNENADFVKLLGTPTIPMEEKLSLVKEIIAAGNVSELTANLMCVLAERGRSDCFTGIEKIFRDRYNDYFKIAEITVTTANALTDEMREKITAKMSAITGKKISIREKLDPTIIGGIVVDYGSTRYDGSVKTRLNTLKNELGSIIA